LYHSLFQQTKNSYIKNEVEEQFCKWKIRKEEGNRRGLEFEELTTLHSLSRRQTSSSELPSEFWAEPSAELGSFVFGSNCKKTKGQKDILESDNRFRFESAPNAVPRQKRRKKEELRAGAADQGRMSELVNAICQFVSRGVYRTLFC
jgi:hypothetical protein